MDPQTQQQIFTVTSLEDWTRSDQYHNSFLLKDDEILDKVLANSTKNGLPEIAVSRAQGKFLNLQARAIKATRILEVGTLGGYSTIWLARALPEKGALITLELNEKHAQVAAANIELAGLSSKVQIIRGPAFESMKELKAEPAFDFVFIDGDKENTLNYFREAKRLVRQGGVIVRVLLCDEEMALNLR
ncbi:O-methyltransferase-domain-containing protein [Mycena floridula]|nr:O-methyltransferase-domain-containing protein [Mycena floridula]